MNFPLPFFHFLSRLLAGSLFSWFRGLVIFDFFVFYTIGIVVEGLKVEEAFFRGRKLQGTTIHLPEGYSGM